MARADSQPVTVTANCDHRESWVSECSTRGYREASSMEGVEAVGVNEVRGLAGAAYSRVDRNSMGLELHFKQGHLNGVHYPEVSASRAPVVVNLRSVGFQLKH